MDFLLLHGHIYAHSAASSQPLPSGRGYVVSYRLGLSLGGSPASKSNRKGVGLVGKERKICGVDLYCQYTEREGS